MERGTVSMRVALCYDLLRFSLCSGICAMRLACLHSNTTYCCIWLVRFAYPLPPTITAHVNNVQILLYYGILYFATRTLLLYHFCTAPSKTLASSSRSSACLVFIFINLFPQHSSSQCLLAFLSECGSSLWDFVLLQLLLPGYLMQQLRTRTLKLTSLLVDYSLVHLAKLLALFLFAFPTTVLLPGYLLPVAPNYSCTTLPTRTATEPNNLTSSSLQSYVHCTKSTQQPTATFEQTLLHSMVLCTACNIWCY